MKANETLSNIMINMLPKQITGHYPNQGITETYTLFVTEKEIGYELDGIKRLCHGIKDMRNYDDGVRHHLTVEEAALYLLRELLDSGYIKPKSDKSFINNFERYFTP